jgi:hypothetical protein
VNSTATPPAGNVLDGYTQFIGNDVEGFDILYPALSQITTDSCASACNSIDACVGFSINSTNTACHLKGVGHGNFIGLGSLDNYFEKADNQNRCFLIYNRDESAFLCIEDGSDWYTDWGDNKYVNLRNPSYSTNPIPAKAVWRYDSSVATFVSVASNSYVYSDSSSSNQLRITYNIDNLTTAPGFWYRTSFTSAPGKIISISNPSSYWSAGTSNYDAAILKLNANDSDKNTTWSILFLPTPTPSRSFPTNAEIFFLIRTQSKILDNNAYYGYLAAYDTVAAGNNSPVVMLSDADNPFMNRKAFWSVYGHFLCLRFFPAHYVSAQNGGYGIGCALNAQIKVYNDNTNPNGGLSSRTRSVSITSDGYISVAGDPPGNCGLYIGINNSGVLVLSGKSDATKFDILPINTGDLNNFKQTGIIKFLY